MDQILRSTPSTLSVTFTVNETPTDPDGNAATFTAKKPDGSVAYTGAATRTGVGVFTWPFVSQSALMRFTNYWSANFSAQPVTIKTGLEIVGDFFFTVSQLRGYDAALNAVKYPYSDVLDSRQSVEKEFERVCKRAFVRRYERETLTGDYTNELWLLHPDVGDVTSLTFDGDDVLSDYLPYIRVSNENSKMIYFTVESGLVWPGDTDIVVEYEHGFADVPYQIHDKAMKRARGLLLGKNARIEDRVSVIQGGEQFGRFNIATPGMDMGFGRYVRSSMGVWHTGIPDVDVVLEDFIYEPEGVA